MDPDTFLTTVYVIVDDYCKQAGIDWAPTQHPRPRLSVSEVLTLVLMSQWGVFQSERGAYRYIVEHWRGAFPSLPERSQLNRLYRLMVPHLAGLSHWLADQLQRATDVYEVLDGFGCAVRNLQRRGRGWLAGLANKGYCNRLRWYFGFHILTSVTPQGVITGLALAPASTKDQPLAEDFLTARHVQHPRLPEVGHAHAQVYVADNGFCGQALHEHWLLDYHVEVITPPKRSKHDQPQWSKAWRRWLASIRQMVETVHDKLLHTFRLATERPHDLYGFRARLVAKAALHNFCIWLNRQLGRPPLAFADLVAW